MKAPKFQFRVMWSGKTADGNNLVLAENESDAAVRCIELHNESVYIIRVERVR